MYSQNLKPGFLHRLSLRLALSGLMIAAVIALLSSGYQLYNGFRVGRIDNVLNLQTLLDQAISTLIPALILNFAVILLFLLVLYRLVIKPVSRISGALDGIDIENPEGVRLASSGDHAHDEIGQLIHHLNNHLTRTELLSDDNTQLRQEVDESYATIRRLIDNLPHHIYLKSQKGDLLLVNEALAETLKLDEKDISGQDPSQLLREYDEKNRRLILEAEDEVLVSQQSLFIPEIDGINSEGAPTAIELRILPIEFRGNPAVLSVGVDISERKHNQSRLKHMAYHDPLTDLPNRHLFLDRLGQSLRRAEESGRFGALLFVDLDNFKNINDSMGHTAGDVLLREAATRLLKVISHEDTLSRLSADEFVICLADVGSEQSEVATLAFQRAEQLRDLLAQPFAIDTQQLTVTASLGVAVYPDGSTSASDLLRNASTARYNAKADGKDTTTQFEQAMAEATAVRLLMEKDLRLAIERGEFYLTFQPQVNVHDNSITGAEALMRWHHPLRGTVSPAEFIPMLENMGLIVTVGEWALNEACANVRRWIDAGLWRPDHVMGINVSPQQFSRPEFFSQVKRAIKYFGIPAHCIDLEITEGMVIKEVEETIIRMSEIRRHGVTFSVDDFGTGYSSLSYLKRLPLDVLKVDQSFVRDLTTDINDAAIVETILAMAQHLNLKTIAEGVETTEQLTFLASIGCLRYQGFLFSAPLTSDDFMRLMVR